MFKFFEKKQLTNKKFDPFRLLDFDYLYNGKCFYCKSRINDQSLFTNSLVVSDGGILTECLKCRSDEKFNLDIGKKTENRNNEYLITFGGNWSEKIEIIAEYINHIYPSWMDLLLSLRLGYWNTRRFVPGYFYTLGFTQYPDQSVTKSDFYKFMHAKFKQEKYKYGNFYGHLFSVDACGECGHNWQPHEKSEREKLHLEISDSGCCSKCKIPNELQWHMRTDFDTELKNLYKRIF
ncbi:MAG: hypothetical protein WD604_15415 [Balneolaceae bacterium]